MRPNSVFLLIVLLIGVASSNGFFVKKEAATLADVKVSKLAFVKNLVAAKLASIAALSNKVPALATTGGFFHHQPNVFNVIGGASSPSGNINSVILLPSPTHIKNVTTKNEAHTSGQSSSSLYPGYEYSRPATIYGPPIPLSTSYGVPIPQH